MKYYWETGGKKSFHCLLHSTPRTVPDGLHNEKYIKRKKNTKLCCFKELFIPNSNPRLFRDGLEGCWIEGTLTCWSGSGPPLEDDHWRGCSHELIHGQAAPLRSLSSAWLGRFRDLCSSKKGWESVMGDMCAVCSSTNSTNQPTLPLPPHITPPTHPDPSQLRP